MSFRCLLVLGLLSLTIAVCEPCWASDESKTLIVSSSNPPCTGASFSRIQDAVDAATDGQQIQVCPGLYPETPVITTPLGLTFMPGALVMPSSVTQSTLSLVSGSPLAGIVTVKNAAGVDIEGLIADAGAAGITQCAPNLMGVIYQNSSGSIKRSWARNTQLGTRLNGCQKNGITANEVGTTVEISRNVVVGIGPTTGAAQNGIQIGYGAQGEI